MMGGKVIAALERARQCRDLRLTAVKLKINGVCVNKCAFCLFNKDPRRLETEDITFFFDQMNRQEFKRIFVNGGEPTIHPHFLQIADLLEKRFKGRKDMVLGTNLIPLARSKGRYPRILRKALDTFDIIEVGCDDEHRNIDVLEQLAPTIVNEGLRLIVNAVDSYCSESTRKRIMTLRERLDFKVTFSEINHFYEAEEAVNDTSIPCVKRVKNLLLNCNGDGFFCFHQEMERPLFNIRRTSGKELNHFLEKYDPGSFNYCACCPRYVPDGNPKHRAKFFLKRLRRSA